MRKSALFFVAIVAGFLIASALGASFAFGQVTPGFSNPSRVRGVRTTPAGNDFTFYDSHGIALTDRYAWISSRGGLTLTSSLTIANGRGGATLAYIRRTGDALVQNLTIVGTCTGCGTGGGGSGGASASASRGDAFTVGNGTCGVAIPFDDTIPDPAGGEGCQILTVPFAASSTASEITISGNVPVSDESSDVGQFICYVSVDTGAGLAVNWLVMGVSGGFDTDTLHTRKVGYHAPDTASHNYQLYCGPDRSTTFVINSQPASTTRAFGGVAGTTLLVQEGSGSGGGGGSGGITTATAPLVVTGSDVSIPQSSASVDGYLSHTDWSTFNAAATMHGTFGGYNDGAIASGSHIVTQIPWPAASTAIHLDTCRFTVGVAGSGSGSCYIEFLDTTTSGICRTSYTCGTPTVGQVLSQSCSSLLVSPSDTMEVIESGAALSATAKGNFVCSY